MFGGDGGERQAQDSGIVRCGNLSDKRHSDACDSRREKLSGIPKILTLAEQIHSHFPCGDMLSHRLQNLCASHLWWECL
jgi:hypothetical protein